MSFFKSLGKVAKGVVEVAAPIAVAVVQPAAIINTVVAGAVKHTPLIKNNNAIPYLNLLFSSGISYVRYGTQTGDWAGSVMPALQEGGMLAGASTLLHQTLKIPMRQQVAPGTSLAVKVGPGNQFSL